MLNGRERFLDKFRQALDDGSFVKLSLGHYRGADATLQRVLARPVQLRGRSQVSFVHRHVTRDLTHNVPVDAAAAQVRELLEGGFAHAHLQTLDGLHELMISKKGQQTLRSTAGGHTAQPSTGHDRARRRWVDIRRPWLAALGVTDEQHRVIPAMARKWKQINRFVELLDRAMAQSPIEASRTLHVLDFGCGKGYLTFAVYDHLHYRLGRDVHVTGVELRQDMVDLCNDAARSLAMEGLRFVYGDVASHAVDCVDVMIALHACDTATDHAMHAGVRANASVIMCAPCCHKELRPQMSLPKALRPMLRHGIHLGQEAEMLTDSLRALLLEAFGYDTQVFEFISLEHTSKNKMVLAVRRATAGDRTQALAQLGDIKQFYGVREQCLEKLLLDPEG